MVHYLYDTCLHAFPIGNHPIRYFRVQSPFPGFSAFCFCCLDFSSSIHSQLVGLVCRADEGTQRLGLGCCERNCYHRGFSEKDKISYYTIVSVWINYYTSF